MLIHKCDFCGSFLEARKNDIYQIRIGVEKIKKSGIQSKIYHEYDMCGDCYSKIIESTFKNGRKLITEQEAEEPVDVED